MVKSKSKNKRTNIKKQSNKNKNKKTKIVKTRIYDIPNYPQSYEFTSSAACTMMIMKYLKKNFQLKKELEFEIWQDTINGSVWHGSRYGIAYAFAKRGIKPTIISNAKGTEGYEKKLAVYEGINLDTLMSSFNEIKKKITDMKITEQYGVSSINGIKKLLSKKKIPIVLVNANAINMYMDPAPHWVVVKGYEKNIFYINDPYSDSTLTMEAETFKNTLGFEGEYDMIVVDISRK
ncbi:MAG: peptidase C39 family protein [Candidatus Micrarchaeia archaeon]